MAAWWRGIVPEKIFEVGNVALVQLELRYLTIVFFLLTWKNCIIFLEAFYYSGHILMFTVLFLGLATLPKSKKSKTEQVEKAQISELVKENSLDV